MLLLQAVAFEPGTIAFAMPTPQQESYEPEGPSSRRTGLVFTEIHYHPLDRPDLRQLEFLEIHNTLPWSEDVSGWRISGEVNFTFPSNTEIAAGGRVVVARVPADIEAHYGLTGVLGPWEGALSNDGGVVRLRKPSDAIVLEVNYGDRPPWPIEADGGGHSLVLVRPSLGERDPRAWAASAQANGSPGQPDPVPDTVLNHIVINEIQIPGTDIPGFVELHNRSDQAVDLGGCWLSDLPGQVQRFVIPTNTILESRAFLHLATAELGFAPSSMNGRMFLWQPDGGRVLNAVSWRTLQPGAAAGRYPDGDRTPTPLRRLAGATPGSANVAPPVPEVVINELMFHPPEGDDVGEWLELHNPGETTVDVGGWFFNEGLTFVFPEISSIPAGGFAVLAKNREAFLAAHPTVDPTLVFGDFSGELDNGGERVALARPAPFPLSGGIVVDEVGYPPKSRWSRWADGRGSTLEKVHPGAPSSDSTSWRDSDESAKAPWSLIETTGQLTFGNTGAEPSDQVQLFLLGEGEALVDEVEVIPTATGLNAVADGGFESGSGWSFDGSHRRSFIRSSDAFSGNRCLHLLADRRGDPGPNRVRSRLDVSIAAGTEVTLRARVRWLGGHPEFLLRVRGGGLEVAGRLTLPADLGTPGAPNSRFVSHLEPTVTDVAHHPVLPPSNTPIYVSARVSPAGLAPPVVLKYRVALKYRLDPGTALTEVAMRDDGLSGDLHPSDGIFTGIIPGQASGTLVAFRVEALTTNGVTSQFPPLAPLAPTAPEAECLVRVGEAPEDGPFGTYRVWFTQATLNRWASSPFRENFPHAATFVYGDHRAIQAAAISYAGNRDSQDSPLGRLVGYDLFLPEGERVQGSDHLTLDWPVRDPTNQRENLMHWFCDQLRLPSLSRRDVKLYLNGQRRGTLYHDTEQPDALVVDSHFPGEDGELFKTSNDNETTDAGVRIRPFRRNELRRFEHNGEPVIARYRWNWRPRARGSGSVLNFSNLIDLATSADAAGPPYQRNLLARIDMENWMRTFAMNDLASNWDSFGNPNWKNTYLYKPRDGRWVLFGADFDVGLGVFNDPANQELFPADTDANINRMYATPAFVRAYWRAMDEALRTFYSGAAVTPLLQKKHAAYQAAGLSFTSPFSPSGAYNVSVPTWIDQRRAFIQPQLDAIRSSFKIATPTNGMVTDTADILVSGSAPVAAAFLEINGRLLDPFWSSVTAWAAQFKLAPGTNHLLLRALDLAGNELTNLTVTVNYTGQAAWPSLVINEWMPSNGGAVRDPADNDADDWFEIYNPTTASVDLANWALTDDLAVPAKYLVPPGFLVPPLGYLLVWADGEPGQNNLVSWPHLHVPFRLAAGGDVIGLYAPDGGLVDAVTFGFAAQNFSYARDPAPTNGVVVLGAPTPAKMNALPAPWPAPALRWNGVRLEVVSPAAPDFSYSLLSSLDLRAWSALGLPVTATGASVTFPVIPDASVRFFRLQRVP